MSSVNKVVYTVTSAPFVLQVIDVDGAEHYRLSGDPGSLVAWSRPNYQAILNMVMTKHLQLAKLFPGQYDRLRVRSAMKIVISQLTESGQLVLTDHGYNFTQLPNAPWTA